MAEWYEHLPIVWVRGMAAVQEAEEDYWAKVAAGVQPAANVDPCAPSLLTAFERVDVALVSTMLAERHPVLALLDASRKDAERPTNQMFQAAEYFRVDRAWADGQAWTVDQKSDRTAFNLRRAVRVAARDADRRLIAADDLEYRRRQCTSGELQDRLVALYEGNPSAMPCTRALNAFNAGFVPFVLPKTPGSKSEREGLSGSFHDIVHLAVGAAYCDVFTCDGRVADWLSGLRTRLGRAPQLSVGRHPAGEPGFVRDLMATWP